MNSFKETNGKHNFNRILTAAMILGVMLLLSGCCLKHEYSKATCEQPQTCTKCGKTEGQALGHTYVNPTCEQPKTCTRCGYMVGIAAGHKYSDATCEQPETCSVCGKTNGKALGHNYQSATCTEPKTCKNCGMKDGEPLGHDFVVKDCTKPITCSRCNAEKPALGHDFAKATCTEPATCKNCGTTKGEATGHRLQSGKCTVCGFFIGSIDNIASIIGLKAEVEKALNRCIVNTDSDNNPYDVEYNYGATYEELISYCDWSLVFDAAYYKKTFPMLAMLYNNDDALLLRHFQTVGIHEGRQGNANFNVGAYIFNCSDTVFKAFNNDDGSAFECYYLYYMFNYDTEKNVNTVKAPKGEEVYQQYKLVLTKLQQEEFEGINKYRADVKVEAVKIDSELNAIANYRAYINQIEGWDAHDWAKKNNSVILQWMEAMNSQSFAENMVQADRAKAKVCAASYYSSPEHYEAMVAAKYTYAGLSNTYYGVKRNSKYYNTYTFDIYMTAADGNPLHQW